MPETQYVPNPRDGEAPPSRQLDCVCEPTTSSGAAPTAGETLLASLIHYWSLDEAAGEPRMDSGGDTLIENGGQVASVLGKNGNAVFLGTGTENLETSGDVSTSNPTSVAVWVYFSALPVTTAEVLNDLAGTYYILVNSAGNVLGGLPGSEASQPLGALSQWHLIVLTSSTTAVGLSVDGSAFATSATPFGEGSSPVMVGDIGGSVQVIIDELMIFDHVLSQAEVALLWNGGAGLFP